MKILMDFYANLFTTSNPQNLDSIMDGVQKVVTEEMNSKLTAILELAIKEMAPLKAPRPDDMPPLFYQTYWTDVGMDISHTVISCLNFGSLLKSINHTLITSIPKVKNLEKKSPSLDQ